MLLFCAEHIDDNNEIEHGVFMSIAEFLPYRRDGWNAYRQDINEAADHDISAIRGEEATEAATEGRE